MVIHMTFTLLIGGILLFIYSIDILSNNLITLSLNNIKKKLFNLTSSTSKSIAVGFLSTALIQSSSAVIMLTISLINAKILTFNNSIGIMLGSNIATTITSFIIGLNLEKMSAYIMLVGAILMINKTKFHKYGKLIFNIGLLFFSLFLMSLAITNFKDNPIFYNYIQSVSSSFILSIIVGALITLILQSSSVFITILQVLSLSNFITIYQAIPFILGANIGTTFDSFYGIINAEKDSKKLAHFNLFFNVSSVIIFSILLKPFTALLNLIIAPFNFNNAINIAIANILFNLLGVLITLPFIPKIKRYYSKW